MVLWEKVEQLVRYCGQYQSHGYMMDERNQDNDFHVELPEEQQIKQSIGKLKVILLTGEAGDGKSRILRNVRELIVGQGFSEPCSDFSALSEPEKQELILRLGKVLRGQSREKLMILANVGVFTQAVLQTDIEMMEELIGGREDVFIRNFEKRNLAENEQVFRQIVDQFLSCEGECDQWECPCYGKCAFERNLKKMTQDEGMEAFRVICNTIYLTGGHITFRELLSLLAYLVTFGESCAERMDQAEGLDGEEYAVYKERRLYYNVFEDSSDLLLRKVANMDPGLKRGSYPEEVVTRKDYIHYRRRQFFEPMADPEERYKHLNVDYLAEYYDVLRHIHCPPYYYDTVQDRNPFLQKLKRGINKMCNQGKSDTGLVVTDTPAIFDKKMHTEFLVIQDMKMIWHRHDLRPDVKEKLADRLWNKFCLSCMAGEESGRKLISLQIDYRQFRYLMMCSEDYFLNRSGMAEEEYSVNTFYRKILETKEHSYDVMNICFDARTEAYCDFSLRIHTEEDWFGGGDVKRSIVIKRED